MNDDIETVRDYVVWVDKATPSKADAQAALDRIEAEVGRLNSIIDDEGYLRQELRAEVERLQRENEQLRAQDDKAWIAWHKSQHGEREEK